MKFAALIDYLQDTDKVNQIRPTHRAYLTSLKEQNQLVAAGPLTDGSGALIVYEAPTAEDAEKLIQADPFHANGIFLKWRLMPWNMVFANKNLMP